MRNLLVAVLILAAMAVAYFYFSGQTVSGVTAGQADVTLPVDLKALIPSRWTVLPKQFYPCDYDGDGQPEWLVFYRYDQTNPSPAFAPDKPVAAGAIGGAVYDLEAGRVRQNPGNASPFRPASLYPYRLLPDIFPGKGQGFLGESEVKVGFWPAYQSNLTQCSVTEIAVFGYSSGPFPTRVSVFRWGGQDAGFLGRHFVGNARVQVEPDPSASRPLTAIRTYDRLDDRSQLCEQHYYGRTATNTLNFVEDPTQATIGFCFDLPVDPAYPEGAVVAVLRGGNPNDGGDNVTPTGDSFLTQAAGDSLPGALKDLMNPQRNKVRILSVENPATLSSYPGAGSVISDTLTNQAWVWNEARVPITTTVVLNGSTHTLAWEVVSLTNGLKSADIHWRIDRVTLR